MVFPCHVAPGLGLRALQKFPIDFQIFQWKCPVQNDNGLALSTYQKMKFQACIKNLLFLLSLPFRSMETANIKLKMKYSSTVGTLKSATSTLKTYLEAHDFDDLSEEAIGDKIKNF